MKLFIFFENLSSKAGLLLAALVSAGLLSAAFVAQYGFGLHPCELCLYQRYPYGAIILLGGAGWLLVKSPARQRTLLLLCGLLFLLDAGIAFYHAGVEWGIFPGPDACSAGASGNESLEEMRKAIMNAPLVPCNQAMTYIFGLSMAAWNSLAAAALSVATYLVWRKKGNA